MENDWAATEASSLLERREQQLPSSKLSIRVSSDPRQKETSAKKGRKSNAEIMLLKKFVVIFSLDFKNICTILHEKL